MTNKLDLDSLSYLRTKRVGSTLVVTFNRPECRNAINSAMEQEFYDCLEIAQDDSEIAVVVLNGAGAVFSAGHDFKQAAEEWQAGGPVGATINGEPWGRSSKLLPSWYFEKPLVAAVHGFVGPHANAILMTCDYVIAARDTKFSWEHTRMGVGAPWGPYLPMFFHFPMRVVTKLWSVGGWMDAEQALALHYVQRVVEQNELETEALNWAEQLAMVEESNARGAKKGIRQVYSEMFQLERMCGIAREPFIGSPAAQQGHVEFLETVLNRGYGAAGDLRDNGVDDRYTKL